MQHTSALHGLLVNRYGERPCYTEEELQAVFSEEVIPKAFHPYAIAIFAYPDISDGFLQKIGSTKTARELRVFLAAQAPFFYLPGEEFPIEESNQLSSNFEHEPLKDSTTEMNADEWDGIDDGGE